MRKETRKAMLMAVMLAAGLAVAMSPVRAEEPATSVEEALRLPGASQDERGVWSCTVRCYFKSDMGNEYQCSSARYDGCNSSDECCYKAEKAAVKKCEQAGHTPTRCRN